MTFKECFWDKQKCAHGVCWLGVMVEKRQSNSKASEANFCWNNGFVNIDLNWVIVGHLNILYCSACSTVFYGNVNVCVFCVIAIHLAHFKRRRRRYGMCSISLMLPKMRFSYWKIFFSRCYEIDKILVRFDNNGWCCYCSSCWARIEWQMTFHRIRYFVLMRWFRLLFLSSSSIVNSNEFYLKKWMVECYQSKAQQRWTKFNVWILNDWFARNIQWNKRGIYCTACVNINRETQWNYLFFVCIDQD